MNIGLGIYIDDGILNFFFVHMFFSLKVSPQMSNKIDKPVYIGKFKILADGQKLHDDRIIPCAVTAPK